ncbi:ANTAR domain-containing protein [Paracoccus kondratievae]|uniref:Transcription antitermination regulator n=1 Tax=Paracoccus kondratievae TaxID=135740 RepID=A0AAD3P0F1_9RHOB|nr:MULTISPECIES: ANTAR domain-containing protein [Paracoccus]QFQ89152.1 ANTAR domain-containing protein [Paracoccus kondratievae]GLK65153.1 transcription antitermination regulator [Paracoccus kondratievae]SMG33735.1 Two-component response regulator, AmiR/NasT family, consists of REC and RNA-binding antiterminator (ANTAR) domains [Paracoccus sp. J56]
MTGAPVDRSRRPAARRLLDDLRQARVLVLHPHDEDRAVLTEHLKRLGCAVTALWPLPAALPPETDTIFVQVDDLPGEALPALLQDRTPAIIAIMTYETPTALQAITDLNAHGVISKPLRPFGILAQFVLARYRRGYEGRLTGKIQKLEETMKSRRLVDRAVKLMAELRGIPDDEAYRLLRDQATARRTSLTSIAEGLLAAEATLRSIGLTIAEK